MLRFRFAIILLLTGVLLNNHVQAQAKADSVVKESILLTPYIPDYYLSDADQDILRSTRQRPEEFRSAFRRSLDLRLSGELESTFKVVSLLQDTTKNAKEDLEAFYSQEALSYAKPVGVGVDKHVKKKKETKADKALLEDQSAPGYMTATGDAMYMQGTVSDTLFLMNALNTYQCKYLLSINQLEIKTNYNSCIDIANKIYRREMIVHYNLISSDGNILSGNLVKAFFPSDSNRPQDIIARCIPVVAEQIAEQCAVVVKPK